MRLIIIIIIIIIIITIIAGGSKGDPTFCDMYNKIRFYVKKSDNHGASERPRILI